MYNLVYLITIHIVPGSYPSRDVDHADSFTFVSALGISEPADAAADAGKGVGRENRDSCEKEYDVRVDQSSIMRVQRTSKALPKQGAHMIQTSCV